MEEQPTERISFLRGTGFFGPEDANSRITIIGCGATGSFVAEHLARMGCHQLRLFDFDKVENHNVQNQAYRQSDIGSYKVDALKRNLLAFNDQIDIITHQEAFISAEHKHLVSGPLVVTTDTMSSRKDIYKTFHLNLDIPIVIETRLGFQHAMINIINPTNLGHLLKWKENLQSDDEIEEGACNERNIVTLVITVAAIVTQHICANFTKDKRRESALPHPKQLIIDFQPEDQSIIRIPKLQQG